MTTLQQIESIQQVFPNVSRNQIRLDLDIAQKLLVANTGAITTVGSLSNVTTSVAWTIPSLFIEFMDFVMYDADYKPIYIGEKNYKYEIENDKFFVYSTTTTPIEGLDCTYAQIIYRSLPTSLSSESTALEVEEYYRDALESYILSKYFAKFPTATIIQGQPVMALNFQAAKYHRDNYNDLRIRLKREVNSRLVSNGAVNYPDAGGTYLPRRMGEAVSAGTVDVSSIGEQYTKFAYFKVTGDVTDQAATIETGYTAITLTVATNTATFSSSAEFDEETIIIPNNWDATWVRNSSSEIVITIPDGWSTFAFEIRERD